MIIGITGTNGSGKGELAQYLVSQDFVHLSVRSFLDQEMYRLQLKPDRDNMRLVANRLRQEHGPAYIVSELLREAQYAARDVVIESVRCPAEAELFESDGLCLLAVDASVEIRYARIRARGSTTDFVSREKFDTQELAESSGVLPWDLHLQKCVAMAEYTFHNVGTVEDLQKDVATWLLTKGI